MTNITLAFGLQPNANSLRDYYEFGAPVVLNVCSQRRISRTAVMVGRPRTDTFRDVVYIPHTPGSATKDVWGIFGTDKRIVPGTGYFRGPKPHLPHQHYTTDLDIDGAIIAPERRYIYGGWIAPHFGHFLLGALPRFWRASELRSLGAQILYHSPHTPEQLFCEPHVAAIFGALGFDASDFVRFDHMAYITELIVPHPAFEEGLLVYNSFARLCHEVGASLTTSAPRDTIYQPIYFTKQFLKRGITKFQNEDELTEVLEKAGVQIVAPEKLTLHEQIEMFFSRVNISGSIGSVFHASIFCEHRKMLILNFHGAVLENYSLTDAVNGNQCHYVYPKDAIETLPATSEFSGIYKLVNPKTVAEQFLLVMEAFFKRQQTVASSTKMPEIVDMARGKYATQSSVSRESSSQDFASDASGAVNGLITGMFGFHTSHEYRPWWHVDLSLLTIVSSVKVFNRLDSQVAKERSASFVLSASDDGLVWNEIFKRETRVPFGGSDGHPFIWCPESFLITRFIRFQLLTTNFLHLDQVQVFGRPA